jgi:hypothetical protein
VGKLSDGDYQKTKLDLQRELAKVMGEIDVIQPGVVVVKQAPKPTMADQCPHCSTKFAQPMKFCGACGKAMVA